MNKFPKELQSAYRNAYNMKPWKDPAIYPKVIEKKSVSEFSSQEKKDLTRKGLRWYVYFNYFNPNAGKSGKFEKHLVPTYGMNREFTKFDNRYKAIHRLLKETKKLLEEGYNPLDVEIVDDEILTMDKALDLAMDQIKLKVSPGTYNNYSIRINQLKNFLKKKKVLKSDTHSFNFKILREFFNQLAKSSSMANRNNALRALKSVFGEMYKSEFIKENYLQRIDIEKTQNNRFKSYSHKQANDILKYLNESDPVLALFIKFIGYNFLRPVEVVRLKVGDLDIENKLLSVFIKQGKYKTKRIPDDIISELSKYDLSKKDSLLFVKDEISGKWNRGEIGRREYYSKKYSKIKTALGFGDGYVMYSFRHTYITIGYKNLRQRLSKDDALDTLMGYTGHDSRDALQKYIHYHDAEVVGEYDSEVK